MSEMKIRSSGLPDWLVKENEARTAKYARNMDDEHFLLEMNEFLQEAENNIEAPSEEPFPVIYFWGVPRCGKTVFSQLLTDSLDLGYPDNIVARYWLAPTHGIKLSKVLLENQAEKSDYASDYGKTSNLSDPHDFAYYWRHWLNIGNIMEHDPDTARADIDFDGFAASMRRMSEGFGKAALFKGVLQTYQLKQLTEAYKKTFVIYVERDYIDSAVSLLKGRRDNYGTPDHWYGQPPKKEQLDTIIDLPYYEQIGGQFKYLTELYEEQLASLDPSIVMRVKYHEFCQDPAGVIENIVAKVKAAHGYEIRIKNVPEASSFRFSRHAPDVPDYDNLVKGLEKFDMPARQFDFSL